MQDHAFLRGVLLDVAGEFEQVAQEGSGFGVGGHVVGRHGCLSPCPWGFPGAVTFLFLDLAVVAVVLL